ncbi:hypothetical protein HK405_010347 [Cladochytrium tenue]|nr:hypothetical protein HK405_010347 [Cladochytrium tenue]
MGASPGAAADLLPPLPADAAAAGLVDPRARSPARAPAAAAALSPNGVASVSANASKSPPAIVPVSTPSTVVKASPPPSDPRPWSRAALDLSPDRKQAASRAAIEARKSGAGANAAAATSTGSSREQHQASSRPRKERKNRGRRPPKPLPQPPQQQQRDTARGGMQSPTAALEGGDDDDDGWAAEVVAAALDPASAAKKSTPFSLPEWRAWSPPPHSEPAPAVAGSSASAASASGPTSPVPSSSSPTPPLTLSSPPVSPAPPPTPPMLSPVSTSGGHSSSNGNGSGSGGNSGGGVGAGIVQLLRDRRWQRTSREPAPLNPEPPQAAVDRRSPPPPPPLSASQPLSAQPYSQYQPPAIALAPPLRDPALRHHRSMDFKEALRDNLGRLFPGAASRGGNGNSNGNGHAGDVAPSDAKRRSALLATSPSPPPQLLPPGQGHLPAVPWPSQHSPAAAAFYTSDTAAATAEFAASQPSPWASTAGGAPDPPAAEFMASLGVLKPHVFGVAVVDAVRAHSAPAALLGPDADAPASAAGAAGASAAGDRVPFVVAACAEYLETVAGLDCEGLYRVPGSIRRVREWIVRFEAAASTAVDSQPSGSPAGFLENETPATVASLLKRYLALVPAAVPQPGAEGGSGGGLFPTRLWDDMNAALRAADPAQERPPPPAALAAARRIFESAYSSSVVSSSAPVAPDAAAASLATARRVLLHLHRVHGHADRNRMGSRNLALVAFPAGGRAAEFAIENAEALARPA